ncbi:MAG: hypothetical protein R8K20_06135 [Gallionellaceae bacterium]
MTTQTEMAAPTAATPNTIPENPTMKLQAVLKKLICWLANHHLLSNQAVTQILSMGGLKRA